ncbi:MAG: DUF58 domain-containing protein [Nitrospirota bacterium]
MIIISGILSEGCLRGIDVERTFPRHIFTSMPFKFRLRITNKKKFLSSYSLSLKEETKITGQDEARIFRIPPRKTCHTGYAGQFERRGRATFKGIIISTLFPFGFIIKSEKRILPREVIVYPRIDKLPDCLKEEICAIGSISEDTKKGSGINLYNIRDYRTGEDSRSIHWKSSARQSRLMIKEFEKEKERAVNLFLVNRFGTGGSISKTDLANFERGVEITASLANCFLKKDYPVGLFSFEGHIPHAQGEKHLYRILNELALLDIKYNKGPSNQVFMGPAGHNGTNILILPWVDQDIAKTGLIFSRILRIGVDA